MLSDQRIVGLRMIEFDLFPLNGDVTPIALWPQPTFMVVILFVTPDAPFRRVSKSGCHMALQAFNFLMASLQFKPGLAVIK